MGREIAVFEGLELYDGKLSRTVLRGQRAVRPCATRCSKKRGFGDYENKLI